MYYKGWCAGREVRHCGTSLSSTGKELVGRGGQVRGSGKVLSTRHRACAWDRPAQTRTTCQGKPARQREGKVSEYLGEARTCFTEERIQTQETRHGSKPMLKSGGKQLEAGCSSTICVFSSESRPEPMVICRSGVRRAERKTRMGEKEIHPGGTGQGWESRP